MDQDRRSEGLAAPSDSFAEDSLGPSFDPSVWREEGTELFTSVTVRGEDFHLGDFAELFNEQLFLVRIIKIFLNSEDSRDDLQVIPAYPTLSKHLV